MACGRQSAVPVTALTGPAAAEPPQDTFTLTAAPKALSLLPGITVSAFAFNGEVPGPELRVRQGDRVEVRFVNSLNVPSSIHWHGVDVPGAEDGVPGLTQAPVPPGGSFTYRFVAIDAGTYWYHSHEDSVHQVGQGLYGALVVAPTISQSPPVKDYTLVVHEWAATPSANPGMNGMAGMAANSAPGNAPGMPDMPGMPGMGTSPAAPATPPALRVDGFSVTAADRNALTEMDAMISAYTLNDRADGGTTLSAGAGDNVRLRIINAGNATHLLTLVGADFRVVAMDGRDLGRPTPLRGVLLPIGAGQRYDIAFTMPSSGGVQLLDADTSPAARAALRAQIGTSPPSAPAPADLTEEPWFNWAGYGSGRAATAPKQTARQFNMVLGAVAGKDGTVFTINGRRFPDVPPLTVRQGDLVRIRIENRSASIHPMHLHGQHFQVLSRDGTPVTGSPIVLDTLNVLPGEEYQIAFRADNPGLWLFHCHDLHHAASGMAMLVRYAGVAPSFQLGQVAE